MSEKAKKQISLFKGKNALSIKWRHGKAKRGHPERDIQKAVMEYLKLKNIFHWKVVNRGFQLPSGAWLPSTVVGIPDMFILLKIGGICAIIGIEIKTHTGQQSEAQKQWQKMLENNNAFYFLVRSIEEVQSAIDYVYDKTMQILQPPLLMM